MKLQWASGMVEPLIYFAGDTTPGKPRDGYLDKIIDWGGKHGFAPEYLEELRSLR